MYGGFGCFASSASARYVLFSLPVTRAYTERSLPQKSHVQSAGLTCPQCHAAVGMASMQTQLEVQIREHIARYYESWTVCDDSTCGDRTRMMGVYGRRCLRPGCRGSVTFEVRIV